jgi:predicted phage tail protein
MSVALAGSVVGLLSLVCLVYVWRGADRPLVPLVLLRVLSAVSALPAFFVSGVPAAAVAAAGCIVVLTVVGLALVLTGHRGEAR